MIQNQTEKAIGRGSSQKEVWDNGPDPMETYEKGTTPFLSFTLPIARGRKKFVWRSPAIFECLNGPQKIIEINIIFSLRPWVWHK